MVTEKTLSHLTGYTKNQIKRRRHNHWVAGVHFWRDEAGATIYALEEPEVTLGYG